MATLTRFCNDATTLAPIVPLINEYCAQRASVKSTSHLRSNSHISTGKRIYECTGDLVKEQIQAWREITDAPCGLNEAHVTPRMLTEDEIRQYINDYVSAAENAVERVGFDGVEIHGANGYLIDQFIQTTVNQRTDEWGGSVENRSRFVQEVTKAVVEAVGADRTAIRLSPFSTFQGMRMRVTERESTFSSLARELARLSIAFLHLVEPRTAGDKDVENPTGSLHFFLDAYADTSPLVLAGGYKADYAKEAVKMRYKNHQVVIAFGRSFIANPDLPYKVQKEIEFTQYDRNTFYLPGFNHLLNCRRLTDLALGSLDRGLS
ncbi:N-ethylmaleimide reductase [Talaromyces pinophilus]|uniref:N-ethylmaleimide reductase n=1 Tax=Talaromyces pinophilus TaxID=128442 RepID=A0A0B8MXQ8_TALPI|nr:N-ethylmaleimide reductase [Talaromyces pinophilus]